MSGKGNSGNASSNSGNTSSSNQVTYHAGYASVTEAKSSDYPKVVSGHQYHQYSRGNYGSERYHYIGKDEDRVPEFLDYGPKSSR